MVDFLEDPLVRIWGFVPSYTKQNEFLLGTWVGTKDLFKPHLEASKSSSKIGERAKRRFGGVLYSPRRTFDT